MSLSKYMLSERVDIKFTNLESTPAITEYLAKKLDQLDKYLDPNDSSIKGQAEIERTTNHHQSGDIFRAELNITIRGNDFRAEAREEDTYAAIDVAKDEMAREIRKNKSKRTSLIRRGGRSIKKLLRRER